MSALATHDSKRGADLRARLNVLSELAPEWNQRVRRWATLNRFRRGKVGGDPAPSPNDEYAIYQTLLGAWPMELAGVPAPATAALDSFRERMAGTVLKSIREAKRRTSWSNPNEAYESACLRFVERILEVDRPTPFLDDFIAFQHRVARFGVLNSLSQLVLTLTAPGVPDLYQGGDLWDLNMVDPDNRRPVDFAARERLLAEIQAPDADRMRHWLANWQDGRIKLAIATAVLRCRRQNADLFRQGGYEPIAVEGSQHLIAFARRNGSRSCVVLAGRMFTSVTQDASRYDGAALFSDARIEVRDLPETLTDVLTGRTLSSAGGLRLGEILADLPVAVLLS
jgi:(1->4)-alpha-D-glucan 1-alpha-D-glucosylmutase